ncbi:MAG: 4-alpha-glucanotransferase [Candidatus Aminicenantaceae bacterium]
MSCAEERENKKQRGSGVLLHITSLPSPYGIGDLGPGAYAFADFLAASKQRYWQVLPLNPTDLACANSPYHSFSAFAFNPLLISPDFLLEDGLLDPRDVGSLPIFSEESIDFRTVIPFKTRILFSAYERFKQRENKQCYEKFCEENVYWLDDYSLFVALKSRFRKRPWHKWPTEIKDRQRKAIDNMRADLTHEIRREKFLQYVFYKQWTSLKNYCNQKGIQVIGDIPIYVVHDSVDVWAHPELFKLDNNKKPYVVAGVPPDYFSNTGQLWGNPLYRWDVMQKRKYDWWVERMAHNLRLFDWVRIDHFRGFVGYWEIPAKEKTAIRGRWVKAPAIDFFKTIKQRFKPLPIVAEDLGIITPDVKEIMDLFDFPGMKVLLFAFGEDNPEHPYLPHTYRKNCLVYTGTHDNNTVQGWFNGEAKPEDKKRLFRTIGRFVPDKEIHWEFIRLGAMSMANTLIVPMQDILGLGVEARMNRPATKTGNWRWRLLPEQLTPALAQSLREITMTSGRA